MKYIWVLGEGPTQGLLDDTTLTVEKSIQLILQSLIKTFASACIIMDQIVIYFLMVEKFINLKQKTLKLM